MCVQCFFGEGMLIVQDSRSTIVALGIVTLHHFLEGGRGGAAKQFYLLAVWDLIQFAYYCTTLVTQAKSLGTKRGYFLRIS